MTPVNNAIEFLLSTLFDLAIICFLLRFIFQVFRADFFNPLSQLIVKVTNPLLIPLRRIIPPVRMLDSACLIIIIALTSIKLACLFGLKFQKFPAIFGLIIWSLGELFTLTTYVFFFAILLQAVLSWVNPTGQNPISGLLHRLTAPLMQPVRRIIPPVGGFDITPIPVIIILQLLIILIGSPLSQSGLIMAMR